MDGDRGGAYGGGGVGGRSECGADSGSGSECGGKGGDCCGGGSGDEGEAFLKPSRVFGTIKKHSL